MKINNYIKILFASLLITGFVSCEDDDLGPFSSLVVDQTEEVQVTLEVVREFTAEGDLLPIIATISRSFDVDAQVTVITELEDQRSGTGVIVIPAGSTTGIGEVLMPGDDQLVFNNFDESGTASATAILADDGNGIIYLPISNEVSFNVFEAFPSISPAESAISMAFLWTTAPADDYDIFYAGGSGATGNAQEFITVINTQLADGPQEVVYNPFSVAGIEDIPYRLIIRTGNPLNGENNLTLIEGTLDAANNDPNINYPLVEITRTSSVDNSNPDAPFDVFDFQIVQLED